MTPRAAHKRDEDATRLLGKLAEAVQAEMRRHHLYMIDAAREMQIGMATLSSLLHSKRVSLDTFTVAARWAGFDVALVPRDET